MGKSGTRSRNDGEEKGFVQRGHSHGNQWSRGHGIRRGGTVAQIEGRQTAIDRTQSSIPSLYDQEGFLQSSQETSASVCIHSTNYMRFSTTVKDKDV